MSNKFDLAAMRADAAAGTPGPWDVDEDWNVFAGDHETGTRVDVAEPMNAPKSLPDSSRIARIPAMEAEIERLLVENARLQALIGRYGLHVKCASGYAFLSPVHVEDQDTITPEEAAEIRGYIDRLRGIIADADLIEAAIIDAHDMDAGPRDYARAVVKALKGAADE